MKKDSQRACRQNFSTFVIDKLANSYFALLAVGDVGDVFELGVAVRPAAWL